MRLTVRHIFWHKGAIDIGKAIQDGEFSQNDPENINALHKSHKGKGGMIMDADRETACCFTGHRDLSTGDVDRIREYLKYEIERLYTENGVTVFYAGGATGFDALASEAVIERRAVHPGIRLVIVIPHKEQAKHWNTEEKAQYAHIKSSADKVICLAEHYYRGCMQRRNRYMVDRSSICICYMTKDTGGTVYTVKYARKQELSVTNLAEAQQKYVSP